MYAVIMHAHHIDLVGINLTTYGKRQRALSFNRKFSLWIITLASLNEICRGRPKKLRSEVCQSVKYKWPSPYKKQVRNLEFQLTSVSRGRVRPPLPSGCDSAGPCRCGRCGGRRTNVRRPKNIYIYNFIYKNK